MNNSKNNRQSNEVHVLIYVAVILCKSKIGSFTNTTRRNVLKSTRHTPDESTVSQNCMS